MMALAARSGRRGVLLGVGAFVVTLLFVLVVKDLNEKLAVMTASNKSYKLMTDQQLEKIAQLTDDLREEENIHKSDVRSSKLTEKDARTKSEKERQRLNAKILQLESELSSAQEQIGSLHSEFEVLSKKHIQMNHHASRLEAENDKLAATNAQLEHAHADAIEEAQAETDRFKSQYQALFKQYQAHTDSIQNLENENERLQLQINDLATANKSGGHNKSTAKPNKPQLKEPVASIKVSSTVKSAALRQQPLQEPIHPEEPRRVLQVQPQGFQKSSTVGQNAARAPVGAEPPHHEKLAAHQILKEDVMEAPKLTGQKEDSFQNFLHNPRAFQQQQQQQFALPQQLQQHHPLQMPHQQNQFHQQLAQPQLVRRVKDETNMDRAMDSENHHKNPDFTGGEEDEDDDLEDQDHVEIQPVRNMANEEDEEDANEDVNFDNFLNARHQDIRHAQLQPADFGLHQVNYEDPSNQHLQRFAHHQDPLVAHQARMAGVGGMQHQQPANRVYHYNL